MDGMRFCNGRSDFRNRAGHGIPPRFSVGYTAMVIRERVEATTLVEQPDKTYRVEPIPRQYATEYAARSDR